MVELGYGVCWLEWLVILVFELVVRVVRGRDVKGLPRVLVVVDVGGLLLVLQGEEVGGR